MQPQLSMTKNYNYQSQKQKKTCYENEKSNDPEHTSASKVVFVVYGILVQLN